MTTTKSYQNGNCKVAIYHDGTKTREWDGNPAPVFPESIDLKVTDFCDAACPFCHEKSTTRGKHATASDILSVVDSLPPGVEIAIGGGNPLSHPELRAILSSLRERGLIANLTVRMQHFIQSAGLISAYSSFGLVHGVGISVEDMDQVHTLKQLVTLPPNVVFHVIAGIAKPQPVAKSGADRILVLGYKKYGFGKKYFKPEIEANLAQWRYWIGSIMRKSRSISFDNLAIEQLRIKEKVTPNAWAEAYMGDDGQFTMYVDAVRMEYAKSSTSPRVPMGAKGIREAFASLQEPR